MDGRKMKTWKNNGWIKYQLKHRERRVGWKENENLEGWRLGGRKIKREEMFSVSDKLNTNT